MGSSSRCCLSVCLPLVCLLLGLSSLLLDSSPLETSSTHAWLANQVSSSREPWQLCLNKNPNFLPSCVQVIKVYLDRGLGFIAVLWKIEPAVPADLKSLHRDGEQLSSALALL